jgi:tRNA A-37 threonylcarbamoyl transferase component Bud32
MASGLSALPGLSSPGDLFSGLGGQVLRRTPHRWTERAVLDGVGRVILKVYGPFSGRVGKVSRNRAPAEVEWDNLQALETASIPVPEGLAAVWTGRGVGGPSAFLMREAEGAVPLDELLRKGEVPPEGWWMEELAPLVQKLHLAGFQHRDLYACHFLIPAYRPMGTPFLIDLARIRRPLSNRRRIKDLAALAYSLQEWRSREEVRELLLNCLGMAKGAPPAQRLLAKVESKVQRIQRHRPKYDGPLDANT